MALIDANDLFSFANEQLCQDLPDDIDPCLAVFFKAIPDDLLQIATTIADDLVAVAQGPVIAIQDQISAAEKRLLDITGALEIKNNLLANLDRLLIAADTFLAEGVPCAELTLLRELWVGLKNVTQSATEKLERLRQEVEKRVQVLNGVQQVIDCTNQNFQQIRGVIDEVSNL